MSRYQWRRDEGYDPDPGGLAQTESEFASGNWRVPPPQPSLSDAQPALFDPPPTCTARGCQAGDRKNLCAWAADIAHGRKDPYAPKPRGCLLRIDPADGVIPF